MAPLSNDVWCAVDLNGSIAKIRLLQPDVRVLPNPADRASERYFEYTKQRQEEHSSIYYSGHLSSSIVTMIDCDEHCELAYNIAVRRLRSASMIVEENLKRCMNVVMQILDMDHTLSTYLTIRCSTNGQPSEEHTKLIDLSYEHIDIGDELGLRVQPDGKVAFSCNNRHVSILFQLDLTVNDPGRLPPTKYYLEFLLNGRVTGLRLVGVYQPTDVEARTLPPAARGGCQATVRYLVCPNGLSGLLLPCSHLCVCIECGQAMINRHNCPNIKCRKPVTGCVKVYKD